MHPDSAIVFNDGACNTECVIHYEGTTDAAQPVPPNPGMHSDPSAAIESSTVHFSQEIVDEDTSRVTYAAALQPLETLLSRARISLQRRIQLSLSYRQLSSRRTRTSLRRFVLVSSRPKMTTPSTLTSTPTPPFRTGSTSSGGRIRTKRMLATTRSRRSWRAQSATRSSSAEDFAVTRPKNDVPLRSVMTSSSRNRQQSQ